MKKLHFVFACVTLLIIRGPLYSQSQSAFYDAKFIYEKCFDPVNGVFTNRVSLYDILSKKYYPPGTVLSEAELKKNPFFAPYVPVSIAQSVANSNFLDKVVPAIGRLNVTKYANALADLMIERAKQELTIAFFNRFKKFAEDNPEFKILFPKTTDNLSNLLTYTYPQMLPKLRDGFFEDLKQITFNLEAFLDLPRYRTLLENFPEIKVAIRSLKLIHRLENGDLSTDKIITEFAAFPEWTEDITKESIAFKNAATTVEFAALLSESLRHEDNMSIWITSQESRELVTEEPFTKIFLGLLYQLIANSNKDLVYYLDSKNSSAKTPLKDLFAKQKDNIFLMQNRVSQFISLAEKVNDAYATIKKKNTLGEKNTNEDYFNYIGVSIDIVEYSFSIVKIFDKNFKTDNYITIAKKSNTLYKDIYKEQYTLAVSDAMDILKNIDTLINKKDISTINNSLVDDALAAKDALNRFSSFIDKLEPYAIFMGNMVEAKDDKDVKAALENVVLPVGSSTIKKNTAGWWGNIAIQSYLGAYGTVHGPASSIQSTWTDKFGVTAPIGIAWTPGSLSWRRGGSISVFASLFDLGAMVDYKLKKDSTITDDGSKEQVVSKDYEVQLGQILSPGGYLVYGFPWNLPLSIGFGAQYGPGLSKIEAAGNTVITNPSWRWNVFLAVDIPLFNIKNKSNVKPSK